MAGNSPDLRPLARVLGALLPSRIVDPSGDYFGRLTETPWSLAERLDAVLETAGVEQPAVAIITDSLVEFLTGWGIRYGNLGDDVERGVGVLCLAVTGDPQLLPGGATLEDAHIVQLLNWALMEDLDETL
jgi:hypothetical protein